MNYVRQILGEAGDDDDPGREEEPEIVDEKPPDEMEPPEDEEIAELANLWIGGNKDDLLRRFLEMDHETAIKVAFAIGYEGALELARMADMEPAAEEATTEPLSIESPDEPVSGILGRAAPEPPIEEIGLS
jgi:hypothetical protein